MKKIVLIIILLAECLVTYAGNPIIVIRCRVFAADAAAIVGVTGRATPPERTCYNSGITQVIDGASCDVPDPSSSEIVITITRADGTAWQPNEDALTLMELQNCNLITAGDNALLTQVLTNPDDPADRGAFVADANGLMEIRFTRDPSQETVIDFLGDQNQDIRIPACPVVAAQIPTMGEWSIIGLTLLILILGVVVIGQSEQILAQVKVRNK